MKLASFEVGADRPFFLIAGPCVIESEALVLEVAGRLRDITETLGIPFVFKASFDKANSLLAQEAFAASRARERTRGAGARA